jgi:hypothetical protein
MGRYSRGGVSYGGRFVEGRYAFDESKHPRGQPENAGEFAKTQGGEKGESVDHVADYKANGTKSKAFKAWFGDSKVVDEKGEPLPVFHGTNIDFDAFRPDESGMFGQERFHMFDPDPAYPKKIGKKVHEVYLSLKNPLISDSIGGYDIAMGTFDKKYFKSKGYDGVRTKEGWWIAFEPTQIKTVDNQGTFDPADARMRYSKDAISEEVRQ